MLFIFSFMAPWTKHSKHRDLSGRKHGTKDWLGVFTCHKNSEAQTRKNTGSLLRVCCSLQVVLGHYRKTLRQPLQSSGSCCFDREEEPQILASLPYRAFDYLQSLRSEVFCYQMQIAPSRHWVKFQICLRGSWRQSCIQIKTCALRPRYVPIMILSCTLENPRYLGRL